LPRKYNIWPLLKEYTEVNPWKVEEKLVKVAEKLSQPVINVAGGKLVGLDKTPKDFVMTYGGHYPDGESAVYGMVGGHEITLKGLEIGRNSWPRLRKRFNGLRPIFVTDILVDGESVLPIYNVMPQGDFMCDC